MYNSSTSGQLRHQRSGVLNRNEMLPEDDDAWDTDLECEGGWRKNTYRSEQEIMSNEHSRYKFSKLRQIFIYFPHFYVVIQQ